MNYTLDFLFRAYKIEKRYTNKQSYYVIIAITVRRSEIEEDLCTQEKNNKNKILKICQADLVSDIHHRRRRRRRRHLFPSHFIHQFLFSFLFKFEYYKYL
jgi:hypothetical protein